MAALSSLYPLVRLKCPGVIDLMMEDSLKKVYREFCRRSEYLQATQQETNVILDQVITLTIPANHYVLNIVRIVRTENAVKTELVPSVDYDHTTPNTITILKDENFTQLDIYYTLVPTFEIDASTEADADILERWSDEIAAGAAAELRLMPGFAWTSPELYDYYRRDFVRGWRDAKRAREEQWDKFQNYTRSRVFY